MSGKGNKCIKCCCWAFLSLWELPSLLWLKTGEDEACWEPSCPRENPSPANLSAETRFWIPRWKPRWSQLPCHSTAIMTRCVRITGGRWLSGKWKSQGHHAYGHSSQTLKEFCPWNISVWALSSTKANNSQRAPRTSFNKTLAFVVLEDANVHESQSQSSGSLLLGRVLGKVFHVLKEEEAGDLRNGRPGNSYSQRWPKEALELL